jgi:hypothetical protein
LKKEELWGEMKIGREECEEVEGWSKNSDYGMKK